MLLLVVIIMVFSTHVRAQPSSDLDSRDIFAQTTTLSTDWDTILSLSECIGRKAANELTFGVATLFEVPPDAQNGIASDPDSVDGQMVDASAGMPKEHFPPPPEIRCEPYGLNRLLHESSPPSRESIIDVLEESLRYVETCGTRSVHFLEPGNGAISFRMQECDLDVAVNVTDDWKCVSSHLAMSTIEKLMRDYDGAIMFPWLPTKQQYCFLPIDDLVLGGTPHEALFVRVQLCEERHRHEQTQKRANNTQLELTDIIRVMEVDARTKWPRPTTWNEFHMTVVNFGHWIISPVTAFYGYVACRWPTTWAEFHAAMANSLFWIASPAVALEDYILDRMGISQEWRLYNVDVICMFWIAFGTICFAIACCINARATKR